MQPLLSALPPPWVCTVLFLDGRTMVWFSVTRSLLPETPSLSHVHCWTLYHTPAVLPLTRWGNFTFTTYSQGLPVQSPTGHIPTKYVCLPQPHIACACWHTVLTSLVLIYHHTQHSHGFSNACLQHHRTTVQLHLRGTLLPWALQNQ